MKCPICDGEVEVNAELESTEMMCKDDDHFFHTFMEDGNVEETFNNVNIFWSTNHSPEDQAEIRFQRKLIIDLARKYYQRKKGWR